MRIEIRVLTAALAAVCVTWALAVTSQARVADVHPVLGCKIPAGALTASAHHAAPPTMASGIHPGGTSGGAGTVLLVVLGAGMLAAVAAGGARLPRHRTRTA